MEIKPDSAPINSNVAKHASEYAYDVRLALAAHPDTPAETLYQLAEDKESGVRQGVASNKNTPSEVLAHLAKDDFEQVRLSVAANPNSPEKTLARLAQDQSEEVRRAADSSLKPIAKEIFQSPESAAPDKPWTGWSKDFLAKAEEAIEQGPEAAKALIEANRESFTTVAALADETVAKRKAVELGASVPKPAV